MAQNSKLTEPKEIRATVLNKADVCRVLYNAAEFHLFGAGSWSADREASAAFWKLLDDFGLTANVPDEPGTIQYTPLGLELNVELMCAAASICRKSRRNRRESTRTERKNVSSGPQWKATISAHRDEIRQLQVA
jgi:hypothetical protein